MLGNGTLYSQTSEGAMLRPLQYNSAQDYLGVLEITSPGQLPVNGPSLAGSL